mmetsp:Transcript_55787/g.172728  ORF Transcript_55787/g.172728 Transcript_55787/m.172728 type:complete len:105 (-) Transcript_55787:710-1024(-)
MPRATTLWDVRTSQFTAHCAPEAAGGPNAVALRCLRRLPWPCRHANAGRPISSFKDQDSSSGVGGRGCLGGCLAVFDTRRTRCAGTRRVEPSRSRTSKALLAAS